jgi:AraC-like DNA-binding protein
MPKRFFLWPARFLPAWQSAGIFPMTVPGCNRSYTHPTIALHLHDYRGDFWIGRERYQLEPGDITFSPSSTISRYGLTRSGKHLCVHFFPAKSGSSAEWLRLPLHLRLGSQTAAARERFWHVIDHARLAGTKPKSTAGYAASAAIQELLLWLYLRTRKGVAPRRNSLVEVALKKLRGTLESSLDQPCSIEELTAGAGLSPAYLARLFAQRYGMTLQHYLLQRRIELARHLLTASDLLVSEIGERVGLPDPQYFNKQFRRVAGVSPLAYRRKNLRSFRTKKGRAISPA